MAVISLITATYSGPDKAAGCSSGVVVKRGSTVYTY